MKVISKDVSFIKSEYLYRWYKMLIQFSYIYFQKYSLCLIGPDPKHNTNNTNILVMLAEMRKKV